jgi:hypothetical protein
MREQRPGYVLIFRPWVTDPKSGKRRYPRRGRVFPIWVKDPGKAA